MPELTFQDRFEIIKNLGSGSFGEVYLIKDRDSMKLYAAKFEKINKTSRLYIEFKTYQHLYNDKPIIGIPKAYQFFQTTDYNVMLMDYLGFSIDELFDKNEHQFTVSTVVYLAIKIIKLLQGVHERGIIHRDIKPNNFMIGTSDYHSIYLLDFGLSKKYVNKNRKHMPFRNGKSLIGTARYASINMHMGIEPSRRDDLESVGYMLVYFLKGRLPWQGIRKKKGKSDLKKIGEIKICTSVEKLCEDDPNCFRQYLDYCRKLSFDSTPNYEYLINLFAESGIESKLEWNVDIVPNQSIKNEH